MQFEEKRALKLEIFIWKWILAHALTSVVPPQDDGVLPENKDGHRLEIFEEKIFTGWENFFICGFSLKERRSLP